MMMKAQIQRVAVSSRRSLVVRATGAPPPPPTPTPPTPVTPVTPPVAAFIPPAAKVVAIEDAMAFTGPAPETINGRLSMLGFVAALGAESVNHLPVAAQFESYTGPVIAVSVLFIAASLIPILNGSNLKKESGIWTPSTELFNGRAAMVGFLAMIILEQVSGKALL